MTYTQAEAIELFLDRTPARSWRGLVEAMPDKEFRNLTRSTIPLLAFWMKQKLDPESAHHVEYKVSSLGNAKASHTDMTIISEVGAVAVEGKSTEARYETVREWLGDSSTRPKVLDHWSSLIWMATRAESDVALVNECVYQMVHRLASVCSVERDQPTLRYQLFDVGRGHPPYGEDLSLLGRSFRTGASVVLELEVIPTILTSGGTELAKRLDDTILKHRPALVREALLTSELFEFGDPLISRIRIDS